MSVTSRKRAGFTLMELAFTVLIIGVCILLLTPIINKIRRNAKIVACEENMHKIGLALKLYASEHKGKFPSDLDELVEGAYVEDESVFDCPASGHIGDSQEPDYHYTTGYTISSPSDTAIVFDKSANHKSGGHVLYLNGNVVWEKR